MENMLSGVVFQYFRVNMIFHFSFCYRTVEESIRMRLLEGGVTIKVEPKEPCGPVRKLNIFQSASSVQAPDV